MPRKCPLNKNICYTSGRNTGAGYPDIWNVHSEFQFCIEDECAFWKENKCGFIYRDGRLFSDEFLTKLP